MFHHKFINQVFLVLEVGVHVQKQCLTNYILFLHMIFCLCLNHDNKLACDCQDHGNFLYLSTISAASIQRTECERARMTPVQNAFGDNQDTEIFPYANKLFGKTSFCMRTVENHLQKTGTLFQSIILKEAQVCS